MLKIFWERGYIDEFKPKEYTVNGKKNAYDTINLSTALKKMLSSCTNFSEEEYLLQSMGRKLGVTINHTPKRHAEPDGEGIEYT